MLLPRGTRIETQSQSSKQKSVFLQKIGQVWPWIKTHKLKSFFILLGIFFLVEVASIPWFDVASLKTHNPPETALMRQRIREAESEAKQLTIRQKWIPLSRLPRYVPNAVIVAEDGTFREHSGFDWFEFKESMQKNWAKKKAARGGSTITQQLAKNLYLSTSKDPVRKLKEAVITLLLEHHLDKNRILEIYLNVIEWGRGIFGIEAAAETYFGRPASTLTFDQALRLAAVIPSPLRHRPNDDSRYVLWRKNMVLVRMQGRDYDEPEPAEDGEAQTEESQSKEIQSRLRVDTEQQDPRNNVPDTMPNHLRSSRDSTDIERGDSNDVQRRKPAD